MLMRLTSAAALAAALLCSPLMGSSQAAEPPKVVLAFPSGGFLYVPIHAAQKLGYLADEGLNVEVIVFPKGGSAALTAVLGGDADAYVGFPAIAIRARTKGQAVRAFAAVQTQLGSTVVIQGDAARKAGMTASSPIADWARALRGLSIGVAGSGSTTDMLVRNLAKEVGLNPDRDLSVMPIGGGPNMLAAFSRRTIGGFSLSPPTITTAEKAGGFVLVDLARGEYEPLAGFLFTTMISRDDWLAKNRGTAEKLVRALWRGEQVLRTDPAIFDAAWAASLPSYPATPRIEAAGVEKNMAFMNAVEAERGAHLRRPGFHQRDRRCGRADHDQQAEQAAMTPPGSPSQRLRRRPTRWQPGAHRGRRRRHVGRGHAGVCSFLWARKRLRAAGARRVGLRLRVPLLSAEPRDGDVRPCHSRRSVAARPVRQAAPRLGPHLDAERRGGGPCRR